MCWSCNPYCGNCKPPKERPRQCLQCKTFNFDPHRTKCKKCGAELPPRVPPPVVMCQYSGLMCANPCNRYKKPPLDGQVKPCKYRTPPPNDEKRETE